MSEFLSEEERKEEDVQDKPRRLNKKSFVQGVVTALLCVAAALLVYVLISVRLPSARPDSIQSLAKISWLQNTIRSEYMGEVDEQAQVDGMLYGIVGALDDVYSTYYTAEEYEEISSAHRGETKGIGIVLMQDATNGDLRIEEVIEDSPAEQAGVQAGDIVRTINGENAEGWTSSEAANAIAAIADEPVVLRVRRDDAELEFSMEKAAIEIRSVTGGMLADDIGYIALSTFNEKTPEQFAELYGQLNDDDMRALIMDLRGNRGGLVDACCKTLEQFLPAGVIVYEEDNKERTETRECPGETPIDIPLVLLVDKSTASSSEIFTGAVQDYSVGTVMGETTLGKGIEQNYYKLPDGGVVKLTTTHYFTPDHRDLHQSGLDPDIDLSDIEAAEGEDTWLAEAVKYIKDAL